MRLGKGCRVPADNPYAMKKVLVAVGLLAVGLAGGVYFWAHAIFASDTVRAAIESQLTAALGQPVRVGSMGATIFPRVTMTLNDVRIGEPARITASRLDVGTAFRALLSRRIEQGSVKLVGARVELPLPSLAATDSAAAPAASTGAPVEIVSIDRDLPRRGRDREWRPHAARQHPDGGLGPPARHPPCGFRRG